MFKKKKVIPITNMGCSTSVQDSYPILITSMAASTVGSQEDELFSGTRGALAGSGTGRDADALVQLSPCSDLQTRAGKGITSCSDE